MRTLDRRLQVALLALGLVVSSGTLALAQEKKPEKKPGPEALELPTGVEYPIKVSVGVWVNSIAKIDEVEGSFTGEIDVRLRWTDARLAFDSRALGLDRQEYGFDEAPAKLATMWTPAISIANMDKGATEDRQGLIINAKGEAELLRRTNAKFRCPLDFSRFPFDQQSLQVELRSPKYGAGQVVFTQLQGDRQQSGVKPGTFIPNWTFERHVGFAVAARRGWTGRDHSVGTATIRAHRETAQYFFQLFLPYFTIMLFPPLALWVPKAEVMPRANMAFSGLFSLIALSYSIFVRYPMLAAVDNVIVRMLWLGYMFMAFVLLLIMTVYNPAFTSKFAGKHVWAEIAAWTTWSMPILFAGSIASTILFSM
jgi:hypothetical protein